MQPVNSPPKVVYPPPSPPGSASTPTIPAILAVPDPAASSATPHPSRQASISLPTNGFAQVFLRTAAIAAGLIIVAGSTYVTGSLVLAQMQSQPHSGRSPNLKPTQPSREPNKPGTPEAERPLPDPDPDPQAVAARIQFDRARQLAGGDNLKAAIAIASQIQPSSPSYGGAQQAIEQWSEQLSDQLLQRAETLYAERQLSAAFDQLRAIPEASTAFPKAQRLLEQWQAQQQAERESNQQHLQNAQQALNQSDGVTAMEEATQITNTPNWQVQKIAIMRAAKPLTHLQTAKQLLEQGEPENAIDEANRLPNAAPWIEKRNQLIQEANQLIADNTAEQKWQETCQHLTDGYLSQCPNVTDLLSSLSKGSSSRLRAKTRRH